MVYVLLLFILYNKMHAGTILFPDICNLTIIYTESTWRVKLYWKVLVMIESASASASTLNLYA